MRKFGLLLIVLAFTFPAFGQRPPASVGYCYYAAGSAWLPIAASMLGTGISIPPPSSAIYGVNGSSYYPLACDASGNIQTSMGNYASAPATCSTGQTYFNTSNATPYYCSATNTWTAFGGGGGSGTVSGQANGVIPLATGATAIGAQSALSDNGTTVTSSEPICTGSCPSTGVTAGALGTPTNWNFDTTSPQTAANSLINGSAIAPTNIAASVSVTGPGLTYLVSAGSKTFSVLGTSSGATNNMYTVRMLESLPFPALGVELCYDNRQSPPASGAAWNVNDINVSACVEPRNALGTMTSAYNCPQATFNGKRSTWITPGQYVCSDPVWFSNINAAAVSSGAPAGYKYYVRTAVSANLPAAPAAPTLTATTGGSLVSATTYYASVTYCFPDGIESLPAMTTQSPGGSNTAFTVTSPAANAAAYGYRLWFGSTTTVQYDTALGCIPIGTNSTILATAAIPTPDFVNGNSAVGFIPQGMSVEGTVGVAGAPTTQTYEAYVAGVDKAFLNAANIPATQSSLLYGPSVILAITQAPKIGIGIVGDSIMRGRGDTAFWGVQNQDGGGWAKRAALNQYSANAWNPTIAPQWGITDVSFSGETALIFSNQNQADRRNIAALGTSTIIDDYGTNDLFASGTSTVGTIGYVTQIDQYFSGLGKNLVRTTLTPRATSTDGFVTLANETFANATYECARRQVNNVILGTSNSAAISGEALCAGKASTQAYNFNFYAGGDGATTTFIFAYPFQTTNAVGSNGETVLVNGSSTTAYTYFGQSTINGVQYSEGVTFTSAPTNGYTVTASYTSAPSMAALVGGNYHAFDTRPTAEVNSSGTPGVSGGLWAIGTPTQIATGQTLTAYSGSGSGPFTLTNSGGWSIAIDAWRGYNVVITGGGCSSTITSGNVYNNSTTAIAVELEAGTCTPNASSTFAVYSNLPTLDGTHPSSYMHEQLAAALVASGLVK